ncbi:hypothetical protein KZ483_16155 [Paenibacillus sp. sptzw28]|uniref:IucA/IucC family protein n=1 Tax=Paenibacillus sp. sptzw28 TaxID=715179 RepID=UPI001C6E080A|nr:IucA/IucC family protein [Paenibacillus sp. sptzw28]QYR19452.1 hypothetical protein KZ483_16155 [Paenibacillus sp. sptzw28]
MIDPITVQARDNAAIGTHSLDEVALASSYVLTDLVNALLAEGLLPAGGQALAVYAGELPGQLRDAYLAADAANAEKLVLQCPVPGAGNSRLLIPVESAYHVPYRFTGSAIIQADAMDNGCVSLRNLDLDALLSLLAECGGTYASEGDYDWVRLCEQVRISVRHKTLSLQVQTTVGSGPPAFPASLLELERWSALRDRPFHPAAKAKEGWDDKEVIRYSAEYAGTFPLEWVALRRDVTLPGSGTEGLDPAGLLLHRKEQSLLAAAFERLGLSSDEYTALPVHPWQLERMLPRELGSELEAGVCIPLGISAGEYAATSSVRSLTPLDDGHHVKLPLGVVSLGAIRSLPALYMTNGDKGQRLLEQLRGADETLSERLFLCDETAWWAFMPKAGDWFDDRPRHLSCQIRRYPAIDQSHRLVPMSAFSVSGPGTGGGHLFDSWLELREMRRGEDTVLQLFGEICDEYLTICMHMLRFGVMPEVHGQNVLLVLKHGRTAGIVLRDHDTVRLYLPWLERNGLADPGYIVKPDRPNSLYNKSAEQLLSYFQTLGIQVNLYSIADSLVKWCGIEEELLWKAIRESLKRAVACAGIPDEDRSTVEELLFERETWPWKQIITPLLQQQGRPGGSMPSGSGRAPNPFFNLIDRGLNVK